jgi:hypothetical protein
VNKTFVYEIRIEGHLTGHWSDWLEEMAIQNDPDGTTILRGEIVDQAALMGLLNTLQALNLEIMELRRIPLSRLG